MAISLKTKLAWLVAHPDLLDGVPGDNEDVTDENRPLLESLVQAMIDAGLYTTKKTNATASRNWGLRALVRQARQMTGAV